MPVDLRRPRPPGFRPRFTLMLVYAFVFFVVYALMFALPALLTLLGPHAATRSPEELQRAAAEISQRALGGGRILFSLALAILTVGFASWRRVLPGLK